MLHAAHDALEYGWHEACVNGTADNRVDEYEFASPFEVYLFLALCVDLELLVAELV